MWICCLSVGDPVGNTLKNLVRIRKAGANLIKPICFLFVKGDWAESGPTLSFPKFSSLYYPCPLCRVPRETLVQMFGFTQTSFPWTRKTYSDIEAACTTCEIIVNINQNLFGILRPRLCYDRSGSNAKGRLVMTDIPGTLLLAGDRLVPSVELPDIGAGLIRKLSLLLKQLFGGPACKLL